MNSIDPIAVLAAPLTLFSHNNVPLGTATGFFWRRPDNKTFFVSNYHVFSGSHYKTGVSLKRNSAFPTRICYPRLISNHSPHERTLHTIELCDEAENDCSWKPHPLHDRLPVDLAVVEIPTTADDGSYVYAVNDDPKRECSEPLKRYPPGFELLLAGYLLEDKPTGYFPIYMRGSVASEMDALYHGKMAFLLDAHTSFGMSGSPVFAVGLDPVDPNKKFSPVKTVPPFVGIYSGRIIETDDGRRRDLQVGVVWRRELIQQIVNLD